MTIRYDGFGAVITESVHEIVASGSSPRTEMTPAESWAVCCCGWEFTSIESAGGGVEPWGAAFEQHVEETDQMREEREDG